MKTVKSVRQLNRYELSYISYIEDAIRQLKGLQSVALTTPGLLKNTGGICTNCRFLRIMPEKILHQLFESWDYYSGNKFYPVPPVKHWYNITTWTETPRDSYHNRNKWKGRYLQLRLDLINHLICGLTDIVNSSTVDKLNKNKV